MSTATPSAPGVTPEQREFYRTEGYLIVRGHWRQQACGEGRLERRRKWIQPFWKGPDGAAEVVERTYSMDKPETQA